MALDKKDLSDIRLIFKEEVRTAVKEDVRAIVKEEVGDVRKIVREEFREGFSSIWEHNLEPTLNTILERLHTIDKELATKPSQHHVDSRFEAMEKSITKNATEPSIMRDRTLNRKTDTVADKLEAKSVFTSEDVREVASIAPVAIVSTSE